MTYYNNYTGIVSPNSSPSPVRMELPNIHDVNPESSTYQICTESTVIQASEPTKLHCQVSQSHLPDIPQYVYCESPISQRQSTSELISSFNSKNIRVDDTVDNAGDGTGDSGVGDMATHTLSRKARDRKYN